MKVTIDIECTPQELRTFAGLPDVEPMQRAVMDEMQRRMLAAMDQMSPTALMKDWLAPMSAMQQSLLGAFTSAAQGAASGAAGSSSRRSTRKRAGGDDSTS